MSSSNQNHNTSSVSMSTDLSRIVILGISLEVSRFVVRKLLGVLSSGRKLLVSGAYNVNEVGLKIGYSTASHYIAAFKKKYGTTPKKYLTAAAASAV